MSSQIHSERYQKRCSACQSDKIGEASDYGESYNICYECGSLFRAEERTEIKAAVNTCPHCQSIDAIVAYGDCEVCNICGLDPEVDDYDAEDLAHLWKSRGPEHEEKDRLIREVMSSEKGCTFDPESNIGSFLRSFCGPHCAYAKACPQTTKNFSRCYQEEKLSQDKDMSKRHRKGQNKIAKAQKRAQKAEFHKLHSRAWFSASAQGWYVQTRKYATENHNRERPEA